MLKCCISVLPYYYSICQVGHVQSMLKILASVPTTRWKTGLSRSAPTPQPSQPEIESRDAAIETQALRQKWVSPTPTVGGKAYSLQAFIKLSTERSNRCCWLEGPLNKSMRAQLCNSRTPSLAYKGRAGKGRPGEGRADEVHTNKLRCETLVASKPAGRTKASGPFS